MDDMKEENTNLPNEEQSNKKPEEKQKVETEKDKKKPEKEKAKEKKKAEPEKETASSLEVKQESESKNKVQKSKGKKSETEAKVEDALSGFDVKKTDKSLKEEDIKDSGKKPKIEKAKKVELAPDSKKEKVEKSKGSTENLKEEADKAKAAESSKDEHHEDYDFDEEAHDEHEDEDYEKLSKEELLERIKEITGREIADISDKKVEAIKEAFYHVIDHEKEDALDEFLKEEGNAKEDFNHNQNKELIQQFKTYYNGFKEKKRKVHTDLNQLKEDNLKIKQDLLESLRQFVDEEEDNVGIKRLKEIEDEWKKAEPIPNNYNRELWANFNALRDRFYDKRSIFFELKELDRKKNETLKKEVIERSKDLLTLNPVNAAVAELKKLHEEYKHIGPVPHEVRQILWDEFKKISDKVHERKQVVAAEFKKNLDENLEKKKVLITQLETFVDYSSEKISEWNDKSREILNIQEEWKKIGPVPREISKEISKSFWSHFKGFFKSKQQFFKVLDEAREQNYDSKTKLCEEVEEINKTTEDFGQHSEKIKQLQRDWKKIGPAPRKKSEEVYKRFKEACDTFFNNLRGHQKEKEKDFEVNLKNKNEIVEKLKALKSLTEENLSEAENLIKEWSELGFVPKKAIKSSKNAINEAVDSLIEKAKDFKDNGLEMAKTKLKALLMKTDFRGSRNIQGEIEKMRHQISKIQDNTVTLKNNMEFFAHTKNAEKLKEDVQQKIDQAEDQVQSLKDKIKLMRQIDN